jgi:hypothetical protein
MRRITYDHLRNVCLYHIFPHYLINDMKFEKTAQDIYIVSFDFLHKFV